MKILFIDDSKAIRRTIEVFLRDSEHSKHQLIFDENGFNALALIAQERPSMIFVDVTMPRLDGLMVCSLVKQNPEFKDIPVIILSGKESIFDRAKGRIAGADDYISKPFSKETLTATIDKFIKKNNEGGEAK